MSNCPIRGIALNMDGVEIQRKRDALCSKLAVLLEARRRLDEIIEHNAGGQHVPGAGAGQLAAESSYDTAADDDFYTLDDDDEPEERPMQWQRQDQVCRQMVYNSSGHVAYSDDNHDLDLDLDDGDNNDDWDEISRDIVALGLHVPHIQQTSEEEAADDSGGRGFGAVPASAAAIAGLQKHRHDGSGSGSDSMCVICMKNYKKGRRLRVMPCAHKHRFHGRCIREWLSWSNLCPLCRHALPTAADAEAEQGEGVGGVRRSTIVRVRVNVNPY